MITTWLGEIGAEAPVDYLDETLDAIGRLAQRPAWTSPGRWLPMQLTLSRPAPPRAAIYLMLLALLLAGVLVALAIGGAPSRLPPPYGLARTGLVAFESNDGIVVAPADGNGRRTMDLGPGIEWAPTWSRQGDRFAFWSASGLDSRASLWVADADGANVREVTRGRTFQVDDGFPSITWSPDGRRLAFTTQDGALFVTDRDGTGLRRIGDEARFRAEPAWSPDGTLIAYRGHARSVDAPSGAYVISPDGVSDVEIGIPAGPVSHLAPEWSPDGRAVIFDSKGDIAISRRDASGRWTEGPLVLGPFLDYLPAWSNAGTQVSFLRELPADLPDETYALMVVDVARPLAHRVFPGEVGFGFQCWTPDDRAIRAIGPDGTRSVLVIPVDGGPVVQLPAPATSTTDVCPLQRLR